LIKCKIDGIIFLCAELGQLSGVAAILRFPMPDISDGGDESSSEED